MCKLFPNLDRSINLTDKTEQHIEKSILNFDFQLL